MSLPGADLVWHCPYVVIFYSDDGRVGGDNYVEYALIKMNGEGNGSNEAAMNRFSMKRLPKLKRKAVLTEHSEVMINISLTVLRMCI